MAEQQPPKSADSGSFSRALLVAVMVAVLYGAILLAADGMISLFGNQDVIGEKDAGPLVGPVMAISALSVVFISVLTGLRPIAGPRRIPVVRAVFTGLAVYVLSPAVGAMVYLLGQGQLLTGEGFFVRYLLSPFVIASAIIAFVTILLLPAISLARSRAR
ncbi:MAG: DUF6121 family protein [Terrimesophilobacter sp.]